VTSIRLLAAAADSVGSLGVAGFDYVPLARIVLAAILGGAIGWEREQHGRDAGLRTHLLLCVGCTLIMLVSLRLPSLFTPQYTGTSVVRADPSRIAAQVITGVGFLGAGAIIVLGRKIRGLTTAACIWVTAAIGLAVGSGYLFVAVFTAAVVLFALHVLARLERRMTNKDQYVRLALSFIRPGARLDEIRALLRPHALDLLDYTVDWSKEGVTYNAQFRYRTAVDFEKVTTDLVENLEPQGLSRVQWLYGA
jgi:putative Mg2+ transporter-C (MgtC) family protein